MLFFLHVYYDVNDYNYYNYSYFIYQHKNSILIITCQI